MTTSVSSLIQSNKLRLTVVAFLSSFFVLFSSSGATASPTAQVLANTQYPVGIVQDASGNVFIADNNNSQLVVVPSASGTLFNTQVVAGQKTVLASVTSITGLAIDPLSGALVMSTGSGALVAYSSNSVSVFGVSVSANTVTSITSSFVDRGIDFDSAGNLFGASSSGLFVLPVVSGSLYGQAVTASTPALVSAGSVFGSDFLADVALDASNALYVTDMFGATGVYVMPTTPRSIFGFSAPANTFTRVVDGANVPNPCGIDLDNQGVLYIGSWGSGNVFVVSSSAVTLFEQSFTANLPTQLTSLNGLGNQGVSVNSDSTRVISGGYANTYVLVGASPNVVPAPATASHAQPDQLAATGATSLTFLALGMILLITGLTFLSIRKNSSRPEGS